MKLVDNIKESPRKSALVIISVVIVLVVIILAIVQSVGNPDNQSTGGVGQAPYGQLTLYNIDTPSKANVPLGEYLSVKEIQSVESSLQVKAKAIKSLAIYDAYVKDGSISIDYDKNIITFLVDIKQLGTTYSTSVDLNSDAVTVTLKS